MLLKQTLFTGAAMVALVSAADSISPSLRSRELSISACSFSRTLSKPSGTSQGTLVDKQEMVDLGVTLEARGNLTHTCSVSCVGGSKAQLYVKYGGIAANPAQYDLQDSNDNGCDMSSSLYMENDDDETMPGSIDVTYWLKVWDYDEVTLSCDCGGEGVVDARTGGNLGGGTCFSESSSVQVRGKGEVAMKDLMPGDNVETSKGYQPVYAFGHRDTAQSADFVQIQTQNNQKPLEMTSEHMVFVVDQISGERTAIPAGNLKKGDLLASKQPAKVTKISTVTRQGLYMPLTEAGTIVVDGILCSNYVSLQQGVPTVVGVSESTFGVEEHTLFHWFMAPYRMWCAGVAPNLCQVNGGISNYLLMGESLAQSLEDMPSWMQICIGWALFVAFALINGVEAVLGSARAPSALLLLGVGARAYWKSGQAVAINTKKEI